MGLNEWFVRKWRVFGVTRMRGVRRRRCWTTTTRGISRLEKVGEVDFDVVFHDQYESCEKNHKKSKQLIMARIPTSTDNLLEPQPSDHRAHVDLTSHHHQHLHEILLGGLGANLAPIATAILVAREAEQRRCQHEAENEMTRKISTESSRKGDHCHVM